jgi:hypothetical protein
MLDDNSATEDGIAIDPFQLQPGEAEQVGEAIASALRAASAAEPLIVHPPEVELAGDWELCVEFLQGGRVHRLAVEQRGPELAGHHRSAQFEGPVQGWLDGTLVQFSLTSRYEGSTISYLFEGEVLEGEMRGTAVLGAAGDQNDGIVNRSQFGAGRWRATRTT